MSPHQYLVPTTHVLLVGEEEAGRVTINAGDFNPALHVKCDVEGNPLEEAEENPDTNGDGVVDEAEAEAAKKKAEAKAAKKAEAKAKKAERIKIRE